MTVFIMGLLCIGCCLMLAGIQKRYQQLQKLARGLLVTYVTILLFGLTGEGYFRFVYAESDGLPTLASQNWLSRYWHTNALGYRDADWQTGDLENHKTVLLVGDSFAAGWGIENPDDRFGNVLAKQLGNQYAVINLGKPGASIIEATENLQKYPLKNPDAVILQYYLNDIENAALSIGLDPKLDLTRDMPGWANESYLANFLYWRLIARFRPEQEGTQTYWNWLYSMYNNATVWDVHLHQLDTFIDLVESKHALLVVVIFPNLLDPVGSIPYVDRVAQAFKARGYGDDSVLKLFDAAEAMSLQERIVSNRDAHASVQFNYVVGEMLYEKLFNLMKTQSLN
jgi:GDSL-like Lipase/Acylhydrolase family